MGSISCANYFTISSTYVVDHQFPPCASPSSYRSTLGCSRLPPPPTEHYRRRQFAKAVRPADVAPSYSDTTNSMPLENLYLQPKGRTNPVGEFMTGRDDLHVVKACTTVEDALETLAKKRITGFPVVDDDWKLVGVVSDYDLLALDSISGRSQADTNLFPAVDSTWKTFSEIQKLLGKTNGKVVGDLMTPSPLVVQESTNLEEAARLLLETKYRRLPVVDADGKLVGIITRGDIVRAALRIKHASEQIG
ncbi:CBS domain-containing protein CBSX2, chloroplastic-like isoform X1 [Coffea eugenioides]|uniref:CBS domain-containing protein CBSX2, chloroplastic isoform X1 n=1 Tax=Coffea arabica TaxID=13443 RepID=A0A6P6WAP3_COFAR|nr:CBS domain-containing protein CBSX2, chloroplastic-like isoform X1 [Coffea arabica]XP_027162982.1 CBS domain-containing protein CBSX2, chloroplastic-like isoform X1 [Coffea eugenioides]